MRLAAAMVRDITSANGSRKRDPAHDRRGSDGKKTLYRSVESSGSVLRLVGPKSPSGTARVLEPNGKSSLANEMAGEFCDELVVVL